MVWRTSNSSVFAACLTGVYADKMGRLLPPHLNDIISPAGSSDGGVTPSGNMSAPITPARESPGGGT